MKRVWGIPIVGSLFLLCLRCVQSEVYVKWGMVEEKPEAMIVDGERVKDAAKYPWHVAILYKEKLHGGGSIISQEYVLTVTHVTYINKQELQPTDLTIKAGMIQLNKANIKPFTVSEIVRYPGYNETSHLHDICLLKVDRKIAFKPTIRPVKLWCNPYNAKANIETLKQKVVGFGLTGSGTHSNDLKMAEVWYRDKANCIKSVPNYKPLLDQNVSFCAIGNKNKATVCAGDSGGGLVYFSERQQIYYLTGLVSQGQAQGNTCSAVKETLYTDVQYYTKWIEQRAIKMEYNLLGFSDCSGFTKNENAQTILPGLVNLNYAFRKSLFVSDCHGVLITRIHVLTQASCVANNTLRKLHSVAVGSSAINSHFEPSQQYTINITPSVEKDLAIITLAKEVDQSIKPVCIPTRPESGNQQIVFWKREVKHPKYSHHQYIQQQKSSLDKLRAQDLLQMNLLDVDLDNERLESSPLLYEVTEPNGLHLYLRALEKCPIDGCGNGRLASFIDILSYVEWIRDTVEPYIKVEELMPPLQKWS